mmetsp:Transcript_40330/g.124981  ORF Transcript_40330/g.124981 Transcript_40330/m.124981 type:complete len:272 (-) Transcript_40330:3-818(-)
MILSSSSSLRCRTRGPKPGFASNARRRKARSASVSRADLGSSGWSSDSASVPSCTAKRRSKRSLCRKPRRWKSARSNVQTRTLSRARMVAFQGLPCKRPASPACSPLLSTPTRTGSVTAQCAGPSIVSSALPPSTMRNSRPGSPWRTITSPGPYSALVKAPTSCGCSDAARFAKSGTLAIRARPCMRSVLPAPSSAMDCTLRRFAQAPSESSTPLALAPTAATRASPAPGATNFTTAGSAPVLSSPAAPMAAAPSSGTEASGGAAKGAHGP